MKMRKSQPENNRYYMRKASGGLSDAIKGYPTIPTADVLCNCVGYANSRFNEIILDPNLKGIYLPFKYQLVCNAENFIESAKYQGLKISAKPTLGGIMVWQRGASLDDWDGAGHVEVVEQINEDGSIVCSSSGYNGWAFRLLKRTNANGRWGQVAGYKFRGCIINPSIGAVTTAKKPEANVKPFTPNKGDKCKVIRKKGLWLYDKPSKKGKHLLRIDYGTVFTVHDTKVGKTSCFAKIKKQNKWGWILIYDKNGVYCENITDKKSYTGEYPNIYRTKMLVDEAVRLAWAKGTPAKKYAWKGGTSTEAFKKALNKVYPNRSGWGAAPKVGCSCDVFAGTVIRSCGLDDNFPRGLNEQFSYKPKDCVRNVYKNAKPIDKSKDGDIVLFDYTGNGAHIVIRGNGYYYEAAYQTTYGHTNNSLERLKKSYPKVVILRPKDYLEKGDKGNEVKKLQKYLNWYNPKLNLAVDGDFNTATKKAVISFQENELGKDKGDGIVGEVTLKAMKKVKK